MPFDPEPYAEGIRKLNEQEARETADRAARARSEASRLAEVIGSADQSISKVYLFGSLVGAGPHRPDFDIDLAIQGGDVYRAMEVAERSDWAVDVVQYDLLPEHVQKRIRERGRVLYEAVPTDNQ